MGNGIRTSDSPGLDKGRDLKLCAVSRVQLTSEEGQRTYRPKRCEYNN